ncbi:LysR family transcriptional regulator [Paenibacillus sp. FSL L8-0696]|uniref:LysR family transcriptional regulator n=1 Tax=Paenibacillus sp. FSL L8-0696 TaxID=2954524 RepID=UPI00311A07DA
MGDIRFGMNKAQIELIVRISEEGSFSKAGGKLNMTQPAVSRAVAAIETELNTVLILRNRKNKLVFTELGELILISFRNILSEFTKIEEFVAAKR